MLPPQVNKNGKVGYANTSSFTENDTVFDLFIYGYHYDHRKRVIDKKMPGKGWEYMVYNSLNQLVLSQDAKQHAIGQWLFTKYDALGRVIIEGLYNDGTSASALRTYLDSWSAVNGNPLWETRTGLNYSNNAFPQTIAYYHTINYYDDYNFLNGEFYPPDGYNQVNADRTKGLPTGSRITTYGTGNMLLTVIYYDTEGKVIKTQAQNHLTGTDQTDNHYSFVGALTYSTRTHIVNGVETKISTSYTYDHMGRKTKTYQRIGNVNSPVVQLSNLSYNEIGQLREKKYHNDIKTTTFTYNERGWLSNSSTSGFEFELKYNAGSVPQYNGNIAIQEWGSQGNRNKNYVYNYDALNRLKSGISNTGNLEKDITYDVMGNLLSLTRDSGLPQDYDYTGTGNRLNMVSGGISRTYAYDINGNATSDGTNGFQYNYLNLISQVTGPNAVTYTYDANGKKLRKVAGVVTTDYVDGIQYTNGVIEFVQTEEGTARRVTNDNYIYEYSLKDHLGNNRYSFDGSGTKVQSDDYYPFGKTYNSFVSGTKNNYLYNGKELQNELGRDGQYDYGARFYDPEIGRWNVVDPLADMFFWQSGYAAFDDNPINKIDPNGMAAYSPIYGMDGAFLGTDDRGLRGKAIIMKKEDFTQGMKHEDAMKKDLAPHGGKEFYKAISDYADYNKFYNHYTDLPNRPDYDGYLTKGEADAWWKAKSGEPLFVDQRKVELPGVTTADFDNKNGNYFYKNFVWKLLSNTGRTYGTIKLTLLDSKTGTVHLGGKYLDSYDYKPDGRVLRDFATWVGRPGGSASGKNFIIYGYGNARVKIEK